MKKRSVFGVVIYILLLVMVLSWILGLFNINTSDIAYSQIVTLFENEQVRSFTVQDQRI